MDSKKTHTEQITWLFITLVFSRKRSENITVLINNISTGILSSVFSVCTLIFSWIMLSFCQSTLSVSNICPKHSSQMCSARHLDYCFGHAKVQIVLFLIMASALSFQEFSDADPSPIVLLKVQGCSLCCYLCSITSGEKHLSQCSNIIHSLHSSLKILNKTGQITVKPQKTKYHTTCPQAFNLKLNWELVALFVNEKFYS